MTDTSMSYVGYCKGCRALCAAAIDDPERPSEVAGHVAQMIRDGLTVQRVDSEVVRSEFRRCECYEAEPIQTEMEMKL